MFLLTDNNINNRPNIVISAWLFKPALVQMCAVSVSDAWRCSIIDATEVKPMESLKSTAGGVSQLHKRDNPWPRLTTWLLRESARRREGGGAGFPKEEEVEEEEEGGRKGYEGGRSTTNRLLHIFRGSGGNRSSHGGRRREEKCVRGRAVDLY